MKKLLSLLTLIAFTTHAFGASTRTISADNTEGFFSGQNLVVDAGFEGRNKGSVWVASGGSLSTTTSSVGRGSVSGTWDASATSQTLKSKLVAIPAGMYGKNGVVSVALKCASGTCTHTLAAYDGSANLITPVTITSSTTTYARTSLNFVFPSSGSIQLLLTSAADEPSVSIDDAYLGLAEGFNVMQVSQAKTLGKHVYDTSSQVWSVSVGGTYTSFSANASIPSPTTYGSGISTPGTKIPAIVLNNVGPGTYYPEFRGIAYTNGTAGTMCRWWDGTTSGDQNAAYVGNPSSGNSSLGVIRGSFYYSTAQSSVTFQLQCRTITGTTQTVFVGNNIVGDTASFELTYLPSSIEIAYRPDLVGSSWSGYHDSTCTWTRTSTSYGDFTADTSCALVQLTNSNFGTVTTTGGSNALPGIDFTPARAGKYEVCVNGQGYSSGVAGTTFGYEFVDGSGTLIAEIPPFVQPVTSGYNIPFSGCAQFRVSSVATFTVKLYGKSSSSVVNINNNAQTALNWTIKQIETNIPTPILVGSVTSGSAGAERIERVKSTSSCSSNPCTIASQSGSWVSSWARNSTGNYTINFAAGTFSAAPNCVVMADNLSPVVASSATSSAYNFATYNSSHTISDSGLMDVICIGPR